MTSIDLAHQEVRALNSLLHVSEDNPNTATDIQVLNPSGKHSVAVGAMLPSNVTVDGHVGYYCAGMNALANIHVTGNAGPGLAENMMSGTVRVSGSASQYCGATAHGGLLIVEGDAAARCGISMKGIDIVVGGSVGHMSAFMAQKGRLVVCGDAGDALGDSIYEARLYVRGEVKSTGADCEQKEMRDEHLEELSELLSAAGISAFEATEFKRYGSARKLYHFSIDNAHAY
ncbi:hypothetical protein AB833_12840 [Chromatiales bacterium (ex Bugula neritina AB1)]|nr:hypothetical protein AB833_12840 [Chromatiales bacterium (ex Bugula neritina AB1)]